MTQSQNFQCKLIAERLINTYVHGWQFSILVFFEGGGVGAVKLLFSVNPYLFCHSMFLLGLSKT